MSDDTQVIPAEQVVPAVEEQPVVEVLPELPELRYEFQPKDDQGRPYGGKQVIKYRTAEELGDRLAEQNTKLIVKLRVETRKNRLGIIEDEAIADSAPRFEQPVSFTPKVLTQEERFQLSRDLLDPEKFEEASSTLFEATIGAKPTDISKSLRALQEESINARAVAEVEAFRRDNPDYIMCQENSDAITNWLVRYNLAPVRSNFKMAFDALKGSKVLIENIVDVPEVPVVVTPEPVAEVLPEPVVVPVAEVTPEPVRRIATGLSRNSSEDVGTAPATGDDIVYEVIDRGTKRRFTGLAAVSAMPADEYRKRVLTDPTFQVKVEKMEAQRAANRNNGRR
jgi:hypothetical protein